MKKLINRAIALSEEYIRASRELEIPDGWNYLRHMEFYNPLIIDNEKFKIAIYFYNNRKSCAVRFDQIEIINYKQSIEFPFDMTQKQFKSILDDAELFLNTYIMTEISNLKKIYLEEKKKKIAEYEKQIELLKQELL